MIKPAEPLQHPLSTSVRLSAPGRACAHLRPLIASTISDTEAGRVNLSSPYLLLNLHPTVPSHMIHCRQPLEQNTDCWWRTQFNKALLNMHSPAPILYKIGKANCPVFVLPFSAFLDKKVSIAMAFRARWLPALAAHNMFLTPLTRILEQLWRRQKRLKTRLMQLKNGNIQTHYTKTNPN